MAQHYQTRYSASNRSSVTLHGETVTNPLVPPARRSSCGRKCFDFHRLLFAGGIVGHRIVAGDLPAGNFGLETCPGDAEFEPLRLHRRVDDANRERLAIGGPGGGHIERRRRLDRDGDRAEMLAIQLQHQPSRVEAGRRLAGLDAADHVDRLRVVGHQDDVALPGVFVQTGGDA